MAWRFVRQPNGLYARFSEVVDNFTDLNLERYDCYLLCIENHNMKNKASFDKILRADMNRNRWKECIKIIKYRHGTKETRSILKFMEPD